jgi:protein TonB
VKKPDTLVETKDKKEQEPEKPKEPEKKEENAGQAGGVEGGVDGGVAGGTVGGVVGGVIGGVLGGTLGGQLGSQTPVGTNTTLSFGEGMTPPVLQNGVQPVYPREALEAKVEGKVIAKCTITEDGHLVDCRIIKGLAYMDGPVLAALAARKYSPVMFQGRAVRVYYTFPFTFKMP